MTNPPVGGFEAIMVSGGGAGRILDDVSKVAYRYAHIDELDARTMHALLRLRSEVFVLEQQCVYLDMDDRDVEPSTIHLWAEREGEVLAYLRLMEDPDGLVRIGRVCTKFGARGQGFAGRLLNYAIKMAGDRRIVLAAQAAQERWYEKFGFARSGPAFMEDGIPHVPMLR